MNFFFQKLVRANLQYKIAIVFLLLILLVELLLFLYWVHVLEPSLRNQAQVYAATLAQSHANVLEISLLSKDRIDRKILGQQMDKILLLTDPNTSRPYIEGIFIEFDYSVVSMPKGTLDGKWGNVLCSQCIVNTLPLFEQNHQELVGRATFFGSNAFFQQLKKDVTTKLSLEAIMMFTALMTVWLAVALMFHKKEAMQKDLQQAKELAEQSNQSKSEFLANMSHEIRTPMNGVVGMLELLQKSPLSTDQVRLVHTAIRSAELQLSLINDILDFSRIEKGKLSLEIIEFSLEKLIEETMALLADRAQTKHIVFSCFLSPRLPKQISGDPTRIKQILFNLLGNAIKFTHQGEVSLVIAPIPIAKKADNLTLRFEVRDTGIGIDPATAQNLFQPFTQADASITRKFGGSGLGLVISRQLAQLMGGNVTLHSTPQVGSTFMVELPFPHFPLHVTKKMPESLMAKKVLIVTRYRGLAGVMERYLAEWNVAFFQTMPPELAVNHFKEAREQQQPYDLAIVDGQYDQKAAFALITALHMEKMTLPLATLLLVSSPQPDDQPLNKFNINKLLTAPLCFANFYLALQSLSDAATPFTLSLSTPVFVIKRFSGKILLVEDTPINQIVASAVLTEMGLETKIVNNGEEAVSWLTDNTCDVVFMDVQMPVMDGLTATRLLRQIEIAEQRPHTPIIAMTAHVLPDDCQRCLDAGMDDFLSKPIRMEKVAAMLARWLRSQSEEKKVMP